MKSYYFLLGLLFSSAAVVTALLGVDIVPPFLAMLGWHFSLNGVRSVTRSVDILSFIIGMAVLYFTIDPAFSALLWYSISFAGMVVVYMFRTVFLHSVGLTRHIWVEALFALLMLGGWVAGNLAGDAGWVAWAALAYPMFFSVFKTIGGLLDYKAIKPLSKKKYKAEVGNPAPGFSLPDHTGKTVNLSDYKGKNSVLLVFVRGDWCPSCHITLRTYERNKEKLQGGNVVVIAIGPDPIGVNSEMVKRLGVSYHLLADEKQECVSRYGIQSHDNNPMTKYESGIPLPATFLVCPDGLIRYTSRADNPGEILNPNDIFPILEKIAS